MILALTGDVADLEAQTNDAVFAHIHGSDGDCEEVILRRNNQPNV